MTTIHDISDLFRLLADNPHYQEEIRRHVLTQELLNLPARFDRFEGRFDQLSGRFDQLGGRFDQLVDRFDRFEVRVERFIEEQRRTNTEVRRDISELKQDMSQIKGGYARDRTIRRAPLIAMRMGLTYVRTLTVGDLVTMAQSSDTSGIEPQELDSFVDADLVMEATTPDGQAIYVAMEISYTANRQDTRRAIRNAQFLTRFTGQPARPALASVRNDPEIADLIAGGQIH